MATAAAAAAKGGPKEFNFLWEGKDKAGKIVRGEMRAAGEAHGQRHAAPPGHHRHQGQEAEGSAAAAGSREKDVALFTRQLATMMKAGVPLLQSFDIVGKGATNPAVARLLIDIKTDVETGSSLAQAFRKYPLYFDALYCNLVAAGEQAGILETLLDRLAIYKEKTLAIKSKIKSALFYPVVDHRGRLRHHRGDHDFRDPGVQAGVHQLRRRPARADAVRDGHLGLVRGQLVHHLPGHGRRGLRLPRGLEALARGADLHGPADA